jgi:hypothetical protein
VGEFRAKRAAVAVELVVGGAGTHFKINGVWFVKGLVEGFVELGVELAEGRALIFDEVEKSSGFTALEEVLGEFLGEEVCLLGGAVETGFAGLEDLRLGFDGNAGELAVLARAGDR